MLNENRRYIFGESRSFRLICEILNAGPQGNSTRIEMPVDGPARRLSIGNGRTLLRGLILTVASLMLIVRPSYAEDAYPNSPIRMVVPFPPGGSSDNVGRIVADRLGRQLNGTIIIENRPGATTQVGTEVVAQAKPDGYTLLLGASTAFTVLPNLRKLNFSIDNFEVIGGVATYVSILAVNNALPVKSLDEFIKYARANPGKLSYGSAGEASFGNIAGGALARHMKLDILHVPFRGSADAVSNAVGGHVDFVIDGAAVPLAKAGQLRPLVAFAQRKHPELPDLPSLKDFDIDIELAHSAGWSVLVPKGTPKPIVEKLSQALEKALADPDVSQQLHKANAIASWQSSPVFRRSVELDRKFYAELLPALGLKKSD
jgi:tripartite-type tricarboxylate transporter receptor subunit TctC